MARTHTDRSDLREHMLRFFAAHYGKRYTSEDLPGALGLRGSEVGPMQSLLSDLKHNGKLSGRNENGTGRCKILYFYNENLDPEQERIRQERAKAWNSYHETVPAPVPRVTFTSKTPWPSIGVQRASASAASVVSQAAPAPASIQTGPRTQFKLITDQPMPNFTKTVSRSIYPFGLLKVGQAFEAGNDSKQLRQRLYSAISARKKKHATEDWKMQVVAGVLRVWKTKD